MAEFKDDFDIITNNINSRDEGSRTLALKTVKKVSSSYSSINKLFDYLKNNIVTINQIVISISIIKEFIKNSIIKKIIQNSGKLSEEQNNICNNILSISLNIIELMNTQNNNFEFSIVSSYNDLLKMIYKNHTVFNNIDIFINSFNILLEHYINFINKENKDFNKIKIIMVLFSTFYDFICHMPQLNNISNRVINLYNEVLDNYVISSYDNIDNVDINFIKFTKDFILNHKIIVKNISKNITDINFYFNFILNNSIGKLLQIIIRIYQNNTITPILFIVDNNDKSLISLKHNETNLLVFIIIKIYKNTFNYLKKYENFLYDKKYNNNFKYILEEYYLINKIIIDLGINSLIFIIDNNNIINKNSFNYNNSEFNINYVIISIVTYLNSCITCTYFYNYYYDNKDILLFDILLNLIVINEEEYQYLMSEPNEYLDLNNDFTIRFKFFNYKTKCYQLIKTMLEVIDGFSITLQYFFYLYILKYFNITNTKRLDINMSHLNNFESFCNKDSIFNKQISISKLDSVSTILCIIGNCPANNDYNIIIEHIIEIYYNKIINCNIADFENQILFIKYIFFIKYYTLTFLKNDNNTVIDNYYKLLFAGLNSRIYSKLISYGSSFILQDILSNISHIKKLKKIINEYFYIIFNELLISEDNNNLYKICRYICKQYKDIVDKEDDNKKLEIIFNTIIIKIENNIKQINNKTTENDLYNIENNINNAFFIIRCIINTEGLLSLSNYEDILNHLYNFLKLLIGYDDNESILSDLLNLIIYVIDKIKLVPDSSFKILEIILEYLYKHDNLGVFIRLLSIIINYKRDFFINQNSRNILESYFETGIKFAKEGTTKTYEEYDIYTYNRNIKSGHILLNILIINYNDNIPVSILELIFRFTYDSIIFLFNIISNPSEEDYEHITNIMVTISTLFVYLPTHIITYLKDKNLLQYLLNIYLRNVRYYTHDIEIKIYILSLIAVVKHCYSYITEEFIYLFFENIIILLKFKIFSPKMNIILQYISNNSINNNNILLNIDIIMIKEFLYLIQIFEQSNPNYINVIQERVINNFKKNDTKNYNPYEDTMYKDILYLNIIFGAEKISEFDNFRELMLYLTQNNIDISLYISQELIYLSNDIQYYYYINNNIRKKVKIISVK